MFRKTGLFVLTNTNRKQLICFVTVILPKLKISVAIQIEPFADAQLYAAHCKVFYKLKIITTSTKCRSKSSFVSFPGSNNHDSYTKERKQTRTKGDVANSLYRFCKDAVFQFPIPVILTHPRSFILSSLCHRISDFLDPSDSRSSYLPSSCWHSHDHLFGPSAVRNSLDVPIPCQLFNFYRDQNTIFTRTFL